MTRTKSIGLLLLLQLAAPSRAGAQDRLAALFPSAPEGYVTDVAGVLSSATRSRVADLADRLRRATGAELAVVTLPTIGRYSAVEVAVAIGRAWGIGADAAIGDARRNAGVVVLLVPRSARDDNSGQIQIATGQGVEGVVPDAIAGRIRDAMLPALREGDYDRGILVGASALVSVVARGFGVSDSALAGGDSILARSPRGGSGFPVRTVVMGVLLVIALVIMFGSASQGGPRGRGRGRRPGRLPPLWWGGMGGGFGRGGFGGGGFGGGGFGGFGGGGGFSGGGAGGRF